MSGDRERYPQEAAHPEAGQGDQGGRGAPAPGHLTFLSMISRKTSYKGVSQKQIKCMGRKLKYYIVTLPNKNLPLVLLTFLSLPAMGYRFDFVLSCLVSFF